MKFKEVFRELWFVRLFKYFYRIERRSKKMKQEDKMERINQIIKKTEKDVVEGKKPLDDFHESLDIHALSVIRQKQKEK